MKLPDRLEWLRDHSARGQAKMNGLVFAGEGRQRYGAMNRLTGKTIRRMTNSR